MKSDIQINTELINFWNENIKISDEEKKEITQTPNLDYKDLAPSIKLYEAIKLIKDNNYILDYGCGNGWASIIAKREGVSKVDAVDLGDNIIDTVKFFSKIFNTTINVFKINDNWLKMQDGNIYDAIICSNVLDVIPQNTTKEIIKEFNRLLKEKGKLIVGLNFYMSKEEADSRGIELLDGNKLFVNDILRLVSLSDDEWVKEFSPYFNIVNLDHFAWPNEKEEKRRLFILEKK